MSVTNADYKEEARDVEELEEKAETSSVKGTIVSVAVVGAVMLITYLLLFGIYMNRV